MFFGRLDGDRTTGGHFDFKAHDGFIDAADLLDVERTITESLAIEDEQIV